MTFSLPAYSRAISSTTGAMRRQGAHRERVLAVRDREPALIEAVGLQPEAPVEIHRGAVGHAAELHEAVARALGLLARRRLTLRARLASPLGRRLAPALVVRQVRLDRLGP